jgi:hypothetical protein
MIYTVELKNRQLQQTPVVIKIEAGDVSLTTGETETEHGTIETPLDYNFVTNDISVGRIPFEHVLYIARL